jgi:hypothetical protein
VSALRAGRQKVFLKGLLESVGLQAQLVNGTPAALATDLLTGKIDALWQGASLPIPALKQVSDASEAVVFGLSDSELASMLKRFSFLSAATVPANTYRGQAAALRSVAAWNFAMAHRDFPSADAYWITKAALSAQPPERIHASAALTRAMHASNNTVIPLHPGALRFYDEAAIRLAVR